MAIVVGAGTLTLSANGTLEGGFVSLSLASSRSSRLWESTVSLRFADSAI
jgi:hypothetical protein